jgi:hypothetical protein
MSWDIAGPMLALAGLVVLLVFLLPRLKGFG